MSKFLIVAKAAAADGNMRWNARWRFSAEAEMGTIFPKYTRVYNFYTHVRPRLYTHTHTGVRKVQMTMALFGAGRWRPLMDSLRATQDGTPCWEEIQMKEFGKYGNTRREIGIVSAPWK